MNAGLRFIYSEANRNALPAPNVQDIFTYNSETNTVACHKRELNDGVLQLTPSLDLLLGYGSGESKVGWVDIPYGLNERVVDLRRGWIHLYNYTDVVVYVPVGDTAAPLLRILPLSKYREAAFSDQQWHVINQPHYIELARNFIDSIKIDIRTDDGQHVSFIRGTAIVKLHIRRKQ